MSLSFPTAPTVGQMYSGFIWDGVKWTSPFGPVPASGSRVWLQTQTVSAAVAYVSFPNVFTGPYDNFEIDITQMGLNGTGNDAPALQVTNNGTTWQTGAIYAYSITGSGGSGPNGYFAANVGGPVSAGYNMATRVRFWSPLVVTANAPKMIDAAGVCWNTGGAVAHQSGIGINQAGYPAIVGVRFFFGGGNNIVRGIFKVYGIPA